MSEEPVRRSTRIAAMMGAFLLFIGAVGMWLSSGQGNASAGATTAETPAVLSIAEDESVAPEPLLSIPEPARERTREEKRLARLDRNDDGQIQQTEYLAARRRNFDKLDTNKDGRVSFEEYAAQGIARFAAADADGDGVLNAAEFATTAPKPRKPTATAARQCPPCQMAAVDE